MSQNSLRLLVCWRSRWKLKESCLLFTLMCEYGKDSGYVDYVKGANIAGSLK
jgi:hypothetical protein